MLNLNQPLQTRDGRSVLMVATTRSEIECIRPLLEDKGIGPAPGETLMGFIEGDTVPSFWEADGHWLYPRDPTEHDIINVPERTREYRTFAPKGLGSKSRVFLGNRRSATLQDAQSFRGGVWPWEGVLEIIREDDKIVDVKFHPPEDADG